MAVRDAHGDDRTNDGAERALHASKSAADPVSLSLSPPLQSQQQQVDECEQLQYAAVNAANAGVTAATPLLLDVAIAKTAAGFGIYFTKRDCSGASPLLVVDGFVESVANEHDNDVEGASHTSESVCAASMSSHDVSESIASTMPPLAHVLQIGDVLVGVNGEACDSMEPVAVIALLRAAPLGGNVLQFRREHTSAVSTADESEQSTSPPKDVGAASIKSSLLGALRKVKTKIKEGIEGDEEQLQREQEERERFEKAWLAEFARLKHEYERKWETCTYSADEFCGLLFRSGDPQQQEYLLREYPLLMEAWKDASVSATARHWPAPRIAYSAPIEYISPGGLHDAAPLDSNRDDVKIRGTTEPPRAPREIRAPPSLRHVLDALRSEFAWRRSDVFVFEQRLAARDVFSCSDLASALEMRSGYFERRFQSAEYPRLTSAICRSLLAHARHGVKADEGISARTRCT